MKMTMQIGSISRCVSVRITSSHSAAGCTTSSFLTTGSLVLPARLLLHRHWQEASEQRMASIVSQQVVAALGGGGGSGGGLVGGAGISPGSFRTPGGKDKGTERSNAEQLVSSLLPPRRLPTIDSSTRVDVLEEKVDKLTSEIGDIKALLKDLVSQSQQ
jgi:hypothetical protein